MPTSDLSSFILHFLPQVIYFTIKYFSLRIVVSDSGFQFPISRFWIPAFSAALLEASHEMLMNVFCPERSED